MTIENDYSDVYDYYIAKRSEKVDINSKEYQEMFKESPEDNDNYINYTEQPITKKEITFRQKLNSLKIKHRRDVEFPPLFHYNYKRGR